MKHQVIIIDVNCLVQEREFNFKKTLLPPKERTEEFLKKLNSKFTVKLYYRGNENRVLNWIVENKFVKYIDDIVTRKEKCNLFIDKEMLNILNSLPDLDILTSASTPISIN